MLSTCSSTDCAVRGVVVLQRKEERRKKELHGMRLFLNYGRMKEDLVVTIMEQ